MAYGNNTRGGLTAAYSGKTVGVWFVDAGNDMMALCVMEATGPGQWEARWNSGFDSSAAYNQRISAAGGPVPWIKTLIDPINKALGQIFGTAPLPPAVTIADKVNDALAASFSLSVVNGAPMLAAK